MVAPTQAALPVALQVHQVVAPKQSMAVLSRQPCHSMALMAQRNGLPAAGNPNGFSGYSPGKASSIVPQSPVDPSRFATQAPIGMAMTTDHKVSSKGSIPQVREAGSIFRDDQVSLDFVL